MDGIEENDKGDSASKAVLNQKEHQDDPSAEHQADYIHFDDPNFANETQTEPATNNLKKKSLSIVTLKPIAPFIAPLDTCPYEIPLKVECLFSKAASNNKNGVPLQVGSIVETKNFGLGVILTIIHNTKQSKWSFLLLHLHVVDKPEEPFQLVRVVRIVHSNQLIALIQESCTDHQIEQLICALEKKEIWKDYASSVTATLSLAAICLRFRSLETSKLSEWFSQISPYTNLFEAHFSSFPGESSHSRLPPAPQVDPSKSKALIVATTGAASEKESPSPTSNEPKRKKVKRSTKKEKSSPPETRSSTTTRRSQSTSQSDARVTQLETQLRLNQQQFMKALKQTQKQQQSESSRSFTTIPTSSNSNLIEKDLYDANLQMERLKNKLEFQEKMFENENLKHIQEVDTVLKDKLEKSEARCHDLQLQVAELEKKATFFEGRCYQADLKFNSTYLPKPHF